MAADRPDRLPAAGGRDRARGRRERGGEAGEKGDGYGGGGRGGRTSEGCDGRAAGLARRVQPARGTGDPVGLEGGGGRRPAPSAVPTDRGPGRDSAHGCRAARWPTVDR